MGRRCIDSRFGIGRWKQLSDWQIWQNAQRYLFENHHAMYTHLVLTEKLWKHLEEVDMECNDMMDMLTVRMAEREGVTEHLKSVDQLGWVRKMNNIRSRAEEVVLHDLIYR